ncbi:MAG: hypothetical protein RSB29_01750 [Alistipes sp.]
MGFRKIITVALLTFLVGCQELPNYFVGDNTLARVGRTELSLRDVESVVPAGATGDDSAAFVALYVDRWIKKQLKLREAERHFSSSAEDIDRMVEEYRQTLLIRKLDQFYVDRSIDTAFSDKEINAYYKEHQTDFRLDRTIVHGRILRFNDSYRQAQKLFSMMSSTSTEQQRNFRDICVKNNFQLTDFTDVWVDFQEFLTLLPTLRSQNYDAALESRQVQQMSNGHVRYYYQITAVRQAGDPIPLEQVRENIRRVLFNQRQSELIRSHEEELYKSAETEGDFRIYQKDKTEKEQ